MKNDQLISFILQNVILWSKNLHIFYPRQAARENQKI